MTAGRWATNPGTNVSVILATSNGGATWKAQKLRIKSVPSNAVAFANGSDSWAVGFNPNTYAGVILATSNGGATWKAQSDGRECCFCTLVAFANDSDGWAVGTQPADRRQRHPRHQQRRRHLEGAELGYGCEHGAHSASPSPAPATTGRSRATTWHTNASVILATSNGGVTWKAQS